MHKVVARLACIVVAFLVLPPSAALRAAEPTAAEKIFAELARLPDAERQARIEEGARKEGRLALIMGIRGELGAQHLDLFRKRYPFVAVETSDMASDNAVERIVAEETAGKHLTDVISTISISDFGMLLEKDMAARYPTPSTKAVLPAYRNFLDPDNRWVLTHWSEQGISYNPQLIAADRAPKSWQDLCKPEFKGTVGIDPSRPRFLYFLREMLGEPGMTSWLECMGKNSPIVQEGTTTRLMLMLAGDHAIEGGNFFYQGAMLNRQNAQKAPFKAVYEAPLMAAPAGAIINKNTPHPYAAALYADWTISPGPQQLLADSFRGPVAAPHPFMPAEAKLITVGVVSPDLAKRLDGLFQRYIMHK